MTATVRFKEEQNLQPQHPDKRVKTIAGEVEVDNFWVQLKVFERIYLYPLHMIERVERAVSPAAQS